MIISTDNTNNFSLTIMLPGNELPLSTLDSNIPSSPLHIDKTVSNVMVEDIDSHIIMANLVPNKNRCSERPQILTASGGSISRRKTDIQDYIGGPHKDFINSNASIINVDDDVCEMIPTHLYPIIDQSGYYTSKEGIKENIPTTDNNICKLFVKEGTPPKLRKKENMGVINKDATNNVSFLTNPAKQEQNEIPNIECLVKEKGETNIIYNNCFKELTPIIHTFSQTNTECHKTDFKVKDHHLDVLSGLNQLRNDGNLLDVTLWAENRPFQAHRVVLASCSEYFQAMFTEPMRERSQTDIHLYGVSSIGLEMILNYIYSSNVSLSLANIQPVLSTASQLQILKVVNVCSTYLENQLDLENCVDVMTLAETYSLPRLRKIVYRHVSQNISKLSNNSAIVERLTAEQMDHLLTSEFPVDVPELRILDFVLSWLGKFKDKRTQTNNYQNEISHKLLRKLIWKQIGQEELKSYITSQMHYIDVAHDKPILSQLLSIKSHYCDKDENQEEFETPSAGLVNLRGLESALIAIGGFGTQGVTNQISYFLPSQGEWNGLTKVPHVECSNFGCATLGNELYVVGGCFDQSGSISTPLQAETVHPFGFRYNPLKNKWSSIRPMLRERCRFTLTSVQSSNSLYAIGGCKSTYASSTEDNEAADDIDDFPMANADAQQNPAGEREPSVGNCGEFYDSKVDKWYPIAAMPSLANISQHAALMMPIKRDVEIFGLEREEFEHETTNNKDSSETEQLIFISGGLDMTILNSNEHQPEVMDHIFVYSVTLDHWLGELRARMPKPRVDHVMLAYPEESNYPKIMFIGGWTQDPEWEEDRILIDEIEVYDIRRDIWSIETKIPTPRYHSGVALVQGKLYVMGGFHSDQQLFDRATGIVECYDFKTKRWSTKQESQNKLVFPSAIWEHVCQQLFVPKIKEDDL